MENASSCQTSIEIICTAVKSKWPEINFLTYRSATS